jgi:RNA polymerase sigma-70 factor (ECF subfamily)
MSAAAASVAAAVASQRDHLLALARRHGSPALDAEDVVHSAIARALEHAGQLRDLRRANAWLARVVRNALLDELRRRGVVTTTDADGMATPPVDDGTGCSCVLAQVEQLPTAHAEILRRVVVGGVPVTNVATELGISANCAMVRLHRARTALAERLRAHCGTTTLRACVDCGCEERGCCSLPAPQRVGRPGSGAAGGLPSSSAKSR